jgi:hypothetical protein
MKSKILALIILLLVMSTNVLAASIASFSVDISNGGDRSALLAQPIRASSVLFQVETNEGATCRYSETKGNSYSNMERTFDLDLETVHKKTLTGLTEGLYKYYVKCRNDSGNESGELEAIFSVNLPINAKIELSRESPLNEGQVEVELTTSKIPSEVPSLSYSYDGVSYGPVPLFGSGTVWKGYLIISNDRKEQIGSFKFQGRDIEGNLGTDITEGGIFIVDTVEPTTIADFKAEGVESGIKLVWSFYESIKEFKIYRSDSPNVDYSNFYKSTTSKSFTDTGVTKGKTYYYKITAVDKAGNEGALSPEVYATVLLQDEIVSPTGLEPRFYGLVDSVLSEIDVVSEDANAIKRSFDGKTEKEKSLYQGLKLSREIDGGVTELGALRREVENYKLQSLARTELDKKLNSAELKLSTIKKKIPENLIIGSEKTNDQQITENDISNAILSLSPETSEDILNEKVKKSLEAINKANFKVKTSISNLEIVYMDGTRKSIALVKETVNSNLERNENISILEIIPREIAESSSELNIKNIEYNVVKENTIVSFYSDTREIDYSLDKNVDLDSIGKIKTLLIQEVETKIDAPLFTGYFSFVNFSENKSNLGIILGVLALAGLFVYFYFIKTTNQLSESLTPMRNKIAEAERKLEENRVHEAGEIYSFLSEHYKKLNKKEKKGIYPMLNSLHSKINVMKSEG